MISVEDVIEFFRNENPDKSVSTYTTMKYNIVRLQKIFMKDIDDITLDDFVATASVMEEVEKYALNTQIQTIMGIKLFLRFINADKSFIYVYNDILKELCANSQEVIEKNEMSENEKENWIDYLDLKFKFEDYYKNIFLEKMKQVGWSVGEEYTFYCLVRNVLLMALYIEIPPTRIGNYQYMMIREKKKREGISLQKSYNYLMNNLDGSFTLIFNKYKTAKFVGQISKTIEKDTLLSDIITLYLEHRKKFVGRKDNTFFLVAKDNKQMSQSNITDTLKYITRKAIGKSLSVNLFRHIYISHFSTSNKSIEETKELATFMGQSYVPNMFDKYVRVQTTEEREKELLQKCTLTFD